MNEIEIPKSDASEPMRRVWHLAFVAAFLAACRGPDAPAGRGTAGLRVLVESRVLLNDAGQAILARPEGLWLDQTGRYLIGDVSDKNVKVYDAAGRRAGTVGRAGHGPGEFETLWSAQAYRDSLVAFDVAAARLSVFAPDGRFVRSLALERAGSGHPVHVRVVDDSLFLVIRSPLGADGSNLLQLIRPDGTTVSSFLNLGGYYEGAPELIQHTGIVADGAKGVVFAALVGEDSLWAFDYRGRRLTGALADPEQPLESLKALMRHTGGHARQPDGSWVMDRTRRVVEVIALDSATAALQISTYSAQTGIDRVEGGTLRLAGLRNGGLETFARFQLAAGLLGRDRSGTPLALRYAGPDQDRYEVLGLRLASALQPGRQP